MSRNNEHKAAPNELFVEAGVALKDTQWLQEKLDRLLETADAEAFRKAPTAYDDALEDVAQALEENKRVKEHGESLMSLVDKCDEAEDAQHVTAIANSLTDAVNDWNFASTAKREEIVVRARRIRSTLDAAVSEAAWLIVPEYVEKALYRLRVGRPLDFGKRFAKLLPRADQQKQILEELAARPNVVPGVVDVETGKIYRISRYGWKRGATAVLPFLFLILAGGLIVLYDWLVKERSGFRDLTVARAALLASFGAVVAGAVAHLAVERLKSLRVFGSPEIYVPGDAIIWLHLRWASIALSLAPILAVWIALRWNGQTNLLLYFFAGYSVDSLSGLVFSRLGAAAETPASTLSNLLGSNTGSQTGAG
jgi:hypothetical protein